jgi:hypothetical protein
MNEVEFQHGPFGTFTKAVALLIGAIGIGLLVVLVALGVRYFKGNDDKIMTKIEHVMRQVVGLGDLERQNANDLTATVKDGDQRIIDHVDANGSKMDRVDSHIAALEQKLAALDRRLPNINIQKYSPGEYRTSNGNIIRREVTVFNNVEHAEGFVWTGWKYKDGAATEPYDQFCYYTIGGGDTGVDFKVDLFSQGKRIYNEAVYKIPNYEEAFGKCQWYGGRIN